MLTKEVSQKFFNNALSSIHAKRAQCLFETSWALVNQANLTITSLGYHKDGLAYPKHKIKSVDRLAGNPKLHQEIPIVYKELFQPMLVCMPIIHILVDWSGCCRQDIHMLRASIVHNGRSITIYNEIHPQSKYGNREIQNRFLATLKKIIPIGKKVIVITDAGFSTPWFKAILKMGWDYIGRLTSYTMVNLGSNDKWVKVEALHKTKYNRIEYMGHGRIGKRSDTPVTGAIYRYKAKNKNRKEKSKYPQQNKRFSTLYKVPWIIATSLKKDKHPGKYVMNCYKKRMQIEQNFRDEKSVRFGFGWRLGRSTSMERIAVLCLIAHITAFFLIYLGTIIEKLGLHKQFQVNTAKKRVLSFLTLGRRAVQYEVLPFNKHYSIAMMELVNSYRRLILC